MALFGNKGDKKPTAKKTPVARKASGKKGKLATIDEVNAATSSVAEEPNELQLVRTKQAVNATPLTGRKDAAYGEFNADTYSETSAANRKSTVEVPDEYDNEIEVGVIYVNEDGRQFYFDEYGATHFADEVEPSPDIPESFEEARHSSSREKFQQEAEAARATQSSEPQSAQYASQQPVEQVNQQQQTFDGGYTQTPPYAAQNPQQANRQQGNSGVNHGNNVPIIDISNATHIENPFAEGSYVINEQIAQGTAQNFPEISTTIASLVNSSKSADDITRTLLGYLQTTIAGEGSDAALKLLGTDNIYAPLLVSALLYNIQQRPIDPIALRDVWDVRPEVKIEEKIVYIKDSSAPVVGERGFWISTEGVEAYPTSIYDSFLEESKARSMTPPVNLSILDY